jgi:2-polyprenyl-3-methyl-5-hydroxy-6-metoxy-1,4-benzoquinol methylase
MPWYADLSRRRRRPEIMDQPGLPPRQHVQALRGLERINYWSGSARILWPAILDALRRNGTPSLRLLDVACGAGDVALRLARKARKAGFDLDVSGCDISPRAVDYARRQAARQAARADFFVGNALEGPLPPQYDIVTCSLFLHHLSETEAIVLLRRMGHLARQMVLVNDLARGLAGFFLAFVGTRLLSSSPVVHVDGPRSVESAFSSQEALRIAERANLAGATVQPRWPCRFLLTWQRPLAARGK